MIAPIAVSLHHWPWSVDVENESVPAKGDGIIFPFFGSPVLSVMNGAQVLLAARYEKFIPLGPPFQNKIEVHEAPHGVLSKHGIGKGEITILFNGKRWNLSVEAKGAKRRLQDDGKTESSLARMILGWSQFFDDLLEVKFNDSSQTGNVSWNNVLEFLKKQRGELTKPRLSLIVRIAEALNTSLPETVSGMRRILLRKRNMQRICRISETDVRCLQWYVRQSGSNMAEKGGRRQELLAVVRQESFDVLENRVLKDFLQRCDTESLRYINNEVDVNPQFVDSKRAQDVRRYREICARSLRHHKFDGIPAAGTKVRPNYVLQSDLRYRNIWGWYCRLLRREEHEDRFWDWQARTWADIVRLLLNSAIVYLESMGSPFNGIHIRQVLGSSLHVTREQVLGSRTRGGSEPGPFVIDRFSNGSSSPIAILEVVHPDEACEHTLVKNLGRTGGHLYVVVRPIEKQSVKNHVLIVWGVNTAGTSQMVPWEDISKSAANALEFHRNVLAGARIPNLPILHGLVANSVLTADDSDVMCEDSDAPIVIMPSDPRHWYDVVEFFAFLLNDWLDKTV